MIEVMIEFADGGVRLQRIEERQGAFRFDVTGDCPPIVSVSVVVVALAPLPLWWTALPEVVPG